MKIWKSKQKYDWKNKSYFCSACFVRHPLIYDCEKQRELFAEMKLNQEENKGKFEGIFVIVKDIK